MHRRGLLFLVLSGLAGCHAVPPRPASPTVEPPWTYHLRITGPDQAIWLEGDLAMPVNQGVEVTVKTPHCGRPGTTPAVALRLVPRGRPVFHVWLAVGDAQGRCAVVDQTMDLAPGQVALLPLPVSMGVRAELSRPGEPVQRHRVPYLTPPSPATILGRAALIAP